MNFRFCAPARTLAGVLIWLTSVTGLLAQTDGIYADFSTSLGSFTCKLNYSAAPKAVANFIGLATAKRAWLDETTGQVKTGAFYNGLIFHRVVSGFMIQGGSPTGTGSGDPGYAFEDEFKDTLRFDKAGVLAMANSGPDSNGSQFFITVSAQSHLNDVHTIFGQVTSGQSVVDTISNVATNSSSKPLTNVVIQTIQIRRVGTAAQNFDINAQGLPIVTNAALRIATGTGTASLSFPNQLYADTRLFSSTNLSDWAQQKVGIDTKQPVATNVSAVSSAGQQFYKAAQVLYPSPLPVPKNLLNKTLVLRFTGGNGTNTTVFDGSGGGSYSWPTYNSSGSVSAYSWDQDPYRGTLYPIYWSGWYPFYLRLDFLSATNGNFSGQYATGAAVSGTFTLRP